MMEFFGKINVTEVSRNYSAPPTGIDNRLTVLQQQG